MTRARTNMRNAMEALMDDATAEYWHTMSDNAQREIVDYGIDYGPDAAVVSIAEWSDELTEEATT